MIPTMIISANLKAVLDEAVHAELYAANLYKHIANQLQRLGYFGAGHGYDLDLGLAHESAIKEAVTDALKRALRTFGNPFGRSTLA